jgi:hypothetical protein
MTPIWGRDCPARSLVDYNDLRRFCRRDVPLRSIRQNLRLIADQEGSEAVCGLLGGSSSAVLHRVGARPLREGPAKTEICCNLPFLSQLRCAPFFTPVDGADRIGCIYSAQTVAEFIGWLEPSGGPQHKVVDALTEILCRTILCQSWFLCASSRLIWMCGR